jgi:predicted enzyme related to lactoylglutathione lyase
MKNGARLSCQTAISSAAPEIAEFLLGYLRVMFTVDDVDETLERLRARGARLVGEMVEYKDVYRLCYIRGPAGLLVGLAQELG